MFGKEQDDVTPAADNRGTSILAQGCRFKGEIVASGTFRVEGEFEGSIGKPENLVIGKSGIVKGNVEVKNAIIGGKLHGNITAENKIELQGGSHVEGDIRTRRLVIDEGVYFEGNCSMGAKNAPGGQTTAKSEAAPTPDLHKQTAQSGGSPRTT
jgi:cytoskeletal protein CcmA (bactofilin family)